MPKASHTEATYEGHEGVVERADGRLNELDPERELDGTLKDGEHPERSDEDGQVREVTNIQADPTGVRPIGQDAQTVPAERDDETVPAGQDAGPDTGESRRTLVDRHATQTDAEKAEAERAEAGAAANVSDEDEKDGERSSRGSSSTASSKKLGSSSRTK